MVIAKHNHPPDYGFIVREICRQLLYNAICEKCDSNIFEKICHILKTLFPELLSGNALPDFETTRQRVWNSPLRDVDIERVKIHYRKISAQNQANNPIINIGRVKWKKVRENFLDDDDYEAKNAFRSEFVERKRVKIGFRHKY